jgi:hypothetical protein
MIKELCNHLMSNVPPMSPCSNYAAMRTSNDFSSITGSFVPPTSPRRKKVNQGEASSPSTLHSMTQGIIHESGTSLASGVCTMDATSEAEQY